MDVDEKQQTDDTGKPTDDGVSYPSTPSSAALMRPALMLQYLSSPPSLLPMLLMDVHFRQQVLAHLLIFINTLRFAGVKAALTTISDIQVRSQP